MSSARLCAQVLTLSYSSESSPALAVFRPHYLFKLTIPGFAHNCLPVSCGDFGFKKILGLELAWKSGLKVPFLPLGGSCPLQTILLSDLVGCDSPLQIVMAFWHTISVSTGLSHPNQIAWFQTKRAPNCHYYISAEGCHTRLDGQHCPLLTYQGVFKGGEILWWYK